MDKINNKLDIILDKLCDIEIRLLAVEKAVSKNG